MIPRLADLSDAADIHRNEVRAAHQPWSERSVRDTLSREDAFAIVLGAPVVGHLIGTALFDEGELLTIAVCPSMRRRGHAKRILHTALSTWVARGVTRVHLEVRADNHGAIALYAQEGFAESGRRAGYYRDGTDAVIMSRISPEV